MVERGYKANTLHRLLYPRYNIMRWLLLASVTVGSIEIIALYQIYQHEDLAIFLLFLVLCLRTEAFSLSICRITKALAAQHGTIGALARFVNTWQDTVAKDIKP